MNQQPPTPPLNDDMAPPSGPAAHGDPSSSTTATMTTTTTVSTTIAASPKKPSQLDNNLRPFMADPARVEARRSSVVLVVEDNKVNQKLARIVVSKAGYQVQIVEHGKACLEYLMRTALWRGPAQAAEGESAAGGGGTGRAATGPEGENAGADEEAEEEKELPTPAVILLDISMPIMGGYEAMTKIHEMEHKGWLVRHVPIVMMGAHYVGADTLKWKREADDLIRKPLRVVELVPKLDEWVEKFGYDGRNGVDVGEFTRMRIGVSCE